MVIGVTSFVRDTEVFSCLRERVIPQLPASATDVWCAGCSDGAELYSMAMLLADSGRCEGYWLGTDCRQHAIDQARDALFNEDSIAAIEPGLRQRWLQRHGQRYAVVPALTHRINWQVADVFDGPYVRSWDLILCRNLAIYLETSAGEQLWTLLTGALRPGGVLIVGKAEKPPRTLGLIQLGPCIYRLRGNC
jgi:chemotaxis methyl-accepting protein methylase